MNRTPASWVIVSRSSGRAVFETYRASTAMRINKERYRVVPILEYLQNLNRTIQEETTA